MRKLNAREVKVLAKLKRKHRTALDKLKAKMDDGSLFSRFLFLTLKKRIQTNNNNKIVEVAKLKKGFDQNMKASIKIKAGEDAKVSFLLKKQHNVIGGVLFIDCR